MEINTVVLGDLEVRSYQIVTSDVAIIVDPGYKHTQYEHFFKVNLKRGKECLILLTHAHFDHIGYADELRKATGVKIAIGELDAPALLNPKFTLSERFKARVKPFEADILLKDGEEFSVGSVRFKTILTPGHTVGSVCYQMGGFLFSGDTLFYESVGRDDFEGGSREALNNSLRRLLTLPDNTVVLPGHNRDTTIAHEKKFNPFILALQDS